MSCFEFSESGIFYTEGDGRETLIGFTDYFSNVSRMPLAGEAGSYALKPLLRELYEDASDDPACFLTDCILAKHHMSSPSPQRLLFLGNTGGKSMDHAGSLLSAFHPFSAVYPFPFEVLDGTPGEEYFDMVVLEADAPVSEPDQKIRAAIRLCNKEGIILCHAPGDPLLDEVFSLLLPDRRDYSPAPGVMLRAAVPKA